MGTVTGATDLPPMPALDDPELSEIVKGVTPLMFLQTALAENRRMMARLDRRLIKPKVMPTIATALLLGIRMLPPRAAAPAAPALRRISRPTACVRAARRSGPAPSAETAAGTGDSSDRSAPEIRCR